MISASIPKRLCRPEFRFIEIPPGEKGPKIKGWQSSAAKPYNSFGLYSHLRAGGNYGVVLGYGNLIVVDVDDVKAMGFRLHTLPKTFTVRTGRGGYHLYYICDGIDSCIRLQHKDKSGAIGGIGDIKARGGQVVGPGSEHPNGCRYEVCNDVDIATITKDKLESILGDLYVKRRERGPIRYTAKEDSDFSIMLLLDEFSLYQAGSQLRGPHPIHGSTNGCNFSVNPQENVWYCFRHGTGGGPWHLLAMMEGLLDCEDCVPGSIGRDTFIELLQIAEERGLIEKRHHKDAPASERYTAPCQDGPDTYCYYCQRVTDSKDLYTMDGHLACPKCRLQARDSRNL